MLIHERDFIYNLIENDIKSENLNIKSSIGWRNYSHNTALPHALLLDIEDLASLQAIVKKIHALNETRTREDQILVRPAAGGRGGRYSQSYSVHGVDGADIVIRLVGQAFCQIQVVDQAQGIVKVGPGVQMGELNKTLFDNHDLVFPTASLNPYITPIGLIANSGIGTGLHQEGIAGLVVSLEMVLSNGTVVKLDQSHPDFEIIRAAHQGLFGFVINAEFKCIKAKKLQCVTQSQSIPELISDIQNGLFTRDDYVSVLIMPLYKPDELTNPNYKNVCVYRWRPIEKTHTNVNARTIFTHLTQELSGRFLDYFDIPNILARHSDWVPFFMRNFAAPIAIGKKDTMSVSDWPDSWHHQTGYFRDLEDTGILFEVNPALKQQEIILAIQKVFETLAEYAKKGEYPVQSGIYIRYLQGTNGGISMSRHKEGNYICSLDIVSNIRTPGHASFQAEIMRFGIETLNARPHLGKFLGNYQTDCPDYNKALLDWYTHYGLQIDKAMLITPHYRKLLNLKPSLVNMESNSSLLEKFSFLTKPSNSTCSENQPTKHRVLAKK